MFDKRMLRLFKHGIIKTETKQSPTFQLSIFMPKRTWLKIFRVLIWILLMPHASAEILSRFDQQGRT